jgi:hypothetical protein
MGAGTCSARSWTSLGRSLVWLVVWCPRWYPDGRVSLSVSVEVLREKARRHRLVVVPLLVCMTCQLRNSTWSS